MNTLRLTTLALGLMVSGITAAQTYVVDRYQDDSNKGSLRWAIEQANANSSEASEILIQAVGKAPYAIKLNSALPEIKAPIKIIGTRPKTHIQVEGKITTLSHKPQIICNIFLCLFIVH